jgi:hypothetical protein
MKRVLIGALPVVAIVLLVGAAFAQMGRGPMAGGTGTMGPGMMSGGMMGGAMMGGQAGQAGCPGLTATGTAATPITEEKAKEVAQQYADTYLKGFTVERILPFTGMHGTMYSVELKGPQDEVRTFHVNPWGNVMPFGGPWRRAS